ncbi:MAG TPA: hydroxyacid dehydrogenase [Burkholderiales bacterium]|jgi:(S)-sulfolactate dehydrogenase|nr:hydroxyacid dehydrogenase [Burkholderiales bacterium]
MAHRIVISEFMDLPAVEQLRGKFDVLYAPDYVKQRAELLAAVKDIPALIVRNLTQVNTELLDAAPKLKVVGRLGVGLDNIDVAACEKRGVKVIPASGANALSVAEYTITTAMIMLRTTYYSSAAVAAGEWPKPVLGRGREIAGKTLGVIGYGFIGRLSTKLAQAMGMQVIACDPDVLPADPVWKATGVRRVSLDELLATADVVTLHVPLQASTRNLMNANAIAKMKQGSALINTSRGCIVDEIALAAALKEGRLCGAALDVFEHEPLAESPHLKNVPNLILTPHVAGITMEANARVSTMIAQEVTAFLEQHG